MPTLKQIRAKMQNLQKQADALIARQAQKVVDQIRGLMIEHGLTTADIEAAAKKRRQRAGRALADTNAKSKMPPKYRNPKTGETWSGHARPPAWIVNAKDRSTFLIPDSAVVATKKAASQSKAGKTLYRDPETGKTWSGHGRAPAWIADAKDRSAFLIGKSAVVKAKPAARKAAVKKVAVKKAVAKKAKPAIAKSTKAKPTSTKNAGAKSASAKTASAKTASAKTTSAKTTSAKTASAKTASKRPAAKRATKAPATPQAIIDSTSTTPASDNSAQASAT
jgi:DNA-binding protein H-NS